MSSRRSSGPFCVSYLFWFCGRLVWRSISNSHIPHVHLPIHTHSKMEEKTDFKALYGHVIQDPEFARLCREKASEPTVTSGAILHALVDPFPRTRYVRTGWCVHACMC